MKTKVNLFVKIALSIFVLFAIITVMTLRSKLDGLKEQKAELEAELEAYAEKVEEMRYELSLSDEEYIEKLENKIENILSDMLGKTPVEVMITLESGTEYIYADETKVNADVTKDQSNLKLEQSDSNHKTYIIVKDAEGNEKPLIVTEKKPVIRGVVVVCESGETPTVSSAVRLAVKSALNVDDEKICIIGRHI